MWKDLLFATVTLLHSRGVTLLAVLSLALGIGATSAIVSVYYQVAVRSLPIEDPTTLVVLESDVRYPGWTRADNRETVFSYMMYEALRQHNQVFSDLIGRTSAPVTLLWRGQPERARAEVVTGNFFSVLGLKPVLGRLIEADDETHNNSTVVLSYTYWAARLGRDPNVLNQRILINGHPLLVVGVAPERFRGLVSGQTPEVYVPVSLMGIISPTWRRTEEVDAYWLNLFGRLKPGLSPQVAAAGLNPVFRSIFEDHLRQMTGVSDETRKAVLGSPLKLGLASQGLNVLREQWQSSVLVLLIMTGFVLVIAFANVASLLSLRAVVRQREIALRIAVGASGWRISRQLVVENMLLGLLGGLAGLIVCIGLSMGLLKLIPEEMSGGWLTAAIDFRLVAFSILLALVTSTCFGLIPAFHALKTDVLSALKQQTTNSLISRFPHRSRQVFVAVQICLSLVLLVGASLFTRTLVNVMSSDSGFVPDHLIVFSVDTSLSGYPRERARALFQDLDARLQAVPSVRSIAHATAAPFGGSGWENGVTTPESQNEEDKYVSCAQNAVSPGYFRTLGIPLRAGREVSVRDTETSAKVAILTDDLARRLFDDADPLGRHIRLGSNDSDLQVVGIVSRSKSGSLRKRPRRSIYIPHAQAEPEFEGQATFFLRTEADDRQAMTAAAAIARQVAGDIPVERMTSMNEMIARSIFKERLLSGLAILFGMVAAILAALGLYGVISYSTARRTREFGIRLCLGADRRMLLMPVLREAAWLLAIGVGTGLPASYALARLFEAQLYGVVAGDVPTYIGATMLILALACTAVLQPAMRVIRMDPSRSLRYE